MQRTFTACVCTIALLLSACGGSAGIGGVMPSPSPSPSAQQTAFPVESAYDTAVIENMMGGTCTTTYTIHRDGGAQRITQTCIAPAETTTLDPAMVAALFADLQAAQPLGALPGCMTIDTPLTVAWNGQQSANLSGSCAPNDSVEQALVQQIDVLMAAFP